MDKLPIEIIVGISFMYLAHMFIEDRRREKEKIEKKKRKLRERLRREMAWTPYFNEEEFIIKRRDNEQKDN